MVGDWAKIALGFSPFLVKSNFFEKSDGDAKVKIALQRSEIVSENKNRTVVDPVFGLRFLQGLVGGGDAVPRHGADDPGVWNVE